MKLDAIDNYFIDIDGTITDYKPGAMRQDLLLRGNFLFPVIRDMMVDKGWNYDDAGDALYDETLNNIYWDYEDLIGKFGICKNTAFSRMRKWHERNLFYYYDMVETVKELSAKGKNLFIMSNNPYWGCCFKLEVAGLTKQTEAPYFKTILGTNIVKGCKNSPEVWKRAINKTGIIPENTATIGDNPDEDGKIPQSCGIAFSYILDRTAEKAIARNDKSIYLNDAKQILTGSI